MTSRVSICFVAPRAFPVLCEDPATPFVGGAELQQVIIAKGLARRGHRVSMICLDYGQQDTVEIDGITVLRAFRLDEGIPVIRFLWPRVTDMWACMKRADADIYYQRAAGTWTGVMAGFCKRHGKKSIFAAAGNPNFHRNTDRVKYRRDRWIYEWGLQNVDRIVVQNPEQAALCRDNFGRESILVPSCYEPPAAGSNRREEDVLWVSTFRTLKRPGLFLELAEAFPEFAFKMIGGPGPDAADARLYEETKARAERAQNVEFLGFVAPSAVGEHFDRAAVLVNTSESEGFPNTFLQSWARGVPTISFVDSGARIDGRPVGRSVESIADMKSAVRNLMLDQAQRQGEGQMCRAYIEANHSLDRILDRYEQIFAGLMSE